MNNLDLVKIILDKKYNIDRKYLYENSCEVYLCKLLIKNWHAMEY